MDYHCDRCGHDCRDQRYLYSNYVPVDDLGELKLFYQTLTVKKLCRKCATKANSFIGYYGKKKPSDLMALNNYLRSGLVSRLSELKIYSQLNYAGYY